MPYSITTKDGITINNIPDDVPPDAPELKERVARLRAGDTSKPQVTKEAPRGPTAIPGARDVQGRTAYDVAQQQQAAQPVTMFEQMFGLGSPIASFVKGAIVNPVVGVNQLLANTGLFGQQVKQGANAAAVNLQANTQAARERVGRDGMDFIEILGGALSPVNKLAGPVKAPRLLETVGRSAASAGAQAAIAPTSNTDNFFEGKADDVVVAAVLGGALPLVGSGLKKGKELAKKLGQPLSAQGKENMVRAWFNELLPQDKTKVMEALRNSEELVPGSRPTAAEATANIPEATTLAAAQKKLAGTQEGRVSQMFAVRGAEQEAAREAALATVAQSPEALAAAKIARSADATKNYGKAFANSIKADPRLAQIAANPYVRDALPDAVKLAEANKVNPKQNLTQFLQYVKIGLDKQLRRQGDTALDEVERKAVRQAKEDLTKWVGQKNPDFEAARNAFAEASKPINQMEIGQYLQGVLRSPLDVERAGMFAKAVAEAPKTIKKASGDVVSETIEKALTPKQAAAVRSVEADLLRMSKAAQNASKTRVGGLGADDAPELPNLLNRWATVTNTVLKALKKDVNTELNQRISQLLLEPQDLAAFLSGMPKEPGKAKVLSSAILERLTPENRAAFVAALSQQEE